MRQRLFDEKVAPRSGCLESYRQVKTARVANEDRPGLTSQSFIQISEHLDPIGVIEAVFRFDLQAFGQHPRQASLAVCRDLDVRAEERPEVSEVPLTDRSQADDQEARDRVRPSLAPRIL
jgi:hypothetical protein